MSRRLGSIGALAVLAVACAREPAAPHGSGHGVLVIAIDGLRADHLSSAGYDRETTPVLDALASTGFAFSNAYAQAPTLLASHIALLTGCDPLVAQRFLPPDVPKSKLTIWSVPESAPSVAREFLSRGYATALFADDPDLAPVYGLSAGFSEFQACEITRETKLGDLGIEGVGERFAQWLKNRGVDENWFAYVHLHDLMRSLQFVDERWDTYFEPRASLQTVPPVSIDESAFFAVPRSKWGGSARTVGEYEARYDGAVRKLDKSLGRLLGRLKEIGRFDGTTICIVGSYGIGFGEAGLYLDSGTLSDVDLHVPMIVHPAKGLKLGGGKRIERVVGLVDVAPTMLDLARLDAPGGMHGSSLATLLRGRDEGSRGYVVASHGLQPGWVVIDGRHCLERSYPGLAENHSFVRSWFGDAIAHRDEVREVLHDREADPRPSHLGPGSADAAPRAELARLAEEWLDHAEDVRSRWQSKGWLSGVADAKPVLPTDGADAPDRR